MRHSRKVFVAAVLVLALSSSTFAGVLIGDVYNPPPPPPPAEAEVIMQGGDPTPTAEDGIIHGDNTNTLAQTVLTVLLSVLP